MISVVRYQHHRIMMVIVVPINIGVNNSPITARGCCAVAREYMRLEGTLLQDII